MRLIKQVALGSFLALGFYFAILYTSCTKDACKTVNCLNGGSCNGGTCTCDTGIGGTNCQTIYRVLYGGQKPGQGQTYLGNAVITYSHLDSAQIDSGYAVHTDDNNTLVFSYGTDSVYTLMKLVWSDGGSTMLSTPITLANNMVTGSTFSVTPTLGGPGDTFTVSGNGSVSTTNASLNLIAVPVHSTTPTIYITLSNCGVQ